MIFVQIIKSFKSLMQEKKQMVEFLFHSVPVFAARHGQGIHAQEHLYWQPSFL